MPIITRQPTANQTPDPGLGGVGVTGISNTGHANTNSACGSACPALGSDNDSQIKTARWSGFAAAPSGASLIKLKFDWTATGSATAGADSGDSGSADATMSFQVEYSLNNGSSWNNAASASAAASELSSPASLNNSGSANITIPNNQDLTQVLVRSRVFASTSCGGGNLSGASANSSTNLTISDIKIEITTRSPGVIAIL